MNLLGSMRDWERTRAMGRTRFVLVRGVLGYGGFMFVVMSVFYILHDGFSYSLGAAPLLLVIWSIAGTLWGFWTWSANERAWRRERQT